MLDDFEEALKALEGNVDNAAKVLEEQDPYTPSLRAAVDEGAVASDPDDPGRILETAIISQLIAYEQTQGWRHLILAMRQLIKLIRWAKDRKKGGNDAS